MNPYLPPIPENPADIPAWSDDLRAWLGDTVNESTESRAAAGPGWMANGSRNMLAGHHPENSENTNEMAVPDGELGARDHHPILTPESSRTLIESKFTKGSR